MDFRSSILAVADAMSAAGMHLSVSEAIKVTDSLIQQKANFSERGPDYSTHNGRVLAALSSEAVMAYMREGKNIDAIKELRAIASCGLKEAKDACEDDRVRDMAGIPRAVRHMW